MSDAWMTYSLVMGSAGCAALSVYPILTRASRRAANKVAELHRTRIEHATKVLDDIFVEVKPKWLTVAYWACPAALAIAGWQMMHHPLGAIFGGGLGIMIPDILVRQMRAIRKAKFQGQLVDMLFILSSSLRAGLSLTQAIEQVSQEMSPPASEEFGLVIKAHRLGRTLEHSLERLNDRMKSEDLRLVTTAILLARETGGDITQVITQLISTIRERKKLADKVNTLTVQGRAQAYIMSALPLAFAFFVRSFNPKYFDQMLQLEIGQLALTAAGVLWVVGIILLRIMSKVDY